jgi:hypothetical protein
VMALFKTHGMVPAEWPSRGARADCGRESVSVHALWLDSDPRTYVPHALHGSERAWTESNCYIDVWIEVAPRAAASTRPPVCLHVLAVDFEGDQWTFFKPPHRRPLRALRLDVQELNVWRPARTRTRGAAAAGGKLVLSEVGRLLPARYGRNRLPHAAHEDDDRDPGARHRASAARLLSTTAGTTPSRAPTSVGLFRLDGPPDPTYMPFFAEFVRVDRRRNLEPQALRRASLGVLHKHLARLAPTNPIARFRQRFATDLMWMQSVGLSAYHPWAFATLRQLGAAFELAAVYVRWLTNIGEVGLEPSAVAFDGISGAAKTLVLKTARAVNTRASFDPSEMLGDAERGWDIGTRLLVERYG